MANLLDRLTAAEAKAAANMMAITGLTTDLEAAETKATANMMAITALMTDLATNYVTTTTFALAEENPALYLLDAQKTTVIRNNRFQTAHGWDIDLDDGSSNYHIYNNLCLQGGLKLREGFGRVVENNILVNNHHET